MRRDTLRRSDEGVSLALAMIFLMISSLVVTAVLSYVSSQLSSVQRTSSRIGASYDADAALKVAANALKTSAQFASLCDAGTPLPVQAPNTSGATVKIYCSPGDTMYGSSFVTSGNALATALTLTSKKSSRSWEDGLVKTKNNVLWVSGGIAANSRILQSGGTGCAATPQPPTANCAEVFVDNGRVQASSCSPAAVSGGATWIYAKNGVSCSSATTVADGYKRLCANPPFSSTCPDLDPLLSWQPVPTCPSSPATKTVEFQPGYYDDAVALTSLTKNCGARLFWFRPGTYYFDFKNGDAPGLTGTSHVWDVSTDATVVAGTAPTAGDVTGAAGKGITLNAWTTAASATPPAVPGACVPPTYKQANGGATFVFGGDSRITMTKGFLEVCAPWGDGTQPPVALWGNPTSGDDEDDGDGDGDGEGDGDADTLQMTATPVSTGTPSFSPRTLTALATPDNSSSTVSISPGRNRSATVDLTVAGFAPVPAAPKGSLLTSAQVLVRHRATLTSSASATATMTLTPTATGTAITPALTVNPTTSFPSGLGETSIDVTSQLAAAFRTQGYTGLGIKYSATANGGSGSGTATFAVDSVRLRLTWSRPTLRSQTADLPDGNCIGRATSASASCDLVTTSGPSTRLYLQGMAYAPSATFDITLTNVSQQVFGWGLVARSASLGISPSADLDGPVVSVPTLNQRAFLTAYLCPVGSGTCDDSDPARIRGRAVATVATDPATGAVSVVVEGWQVPPY
ncbi:MAG: hypothetical protein HY830_10290 [Actinobacteria bacterium]|nr:hypothetical protein [Actinomycetota bacterium]